MKPILDDDPVMSSQCSIIELHARFSDTDVFRDLCARWRLSELLDCYCMPTKTTFVLLCCWQMCKHPGRCVNILSDAVFRDLSSPVIWFLVHQICYVQIVSIPAGPIYKGSTCRCPWHQTIIGLAGISGNTFRWGIHRPQVTRRGKLTSVRHSGGRDKNKY